MTEYTTEPPRDLSDILRALVRLLCVQRDGAQIGDFTTTFDAPGTPDGEVDFHFPDSPALDHHFVISDGKAHVAPGARHDASTIYTSWQAYVDFFSNQAKPLQLFLDGDWAFRHGTLGALDARDLEPGITALESLLPVLPEVPEGFRDALAEAHFRLGPVHTVERLAYGDHAHFGERYAPRGRPLILCDSLRDWPRFEWTFENLVRLLGSKYVLSDGRALTLIPLKDYLERVARNDPVPFKLGFPLTRELRERYRYPKGYAPEQFFRKSQEMICAFGDAQSTQGYGAATVWHRDMADNFLVQLIGTKRVMLAPPSDALYLYLKKMPPTHSNVEFDYSAVNPQAPDMYQHPLFTRVSVVTCTLDPGDTLYIPCGWFHNVQNLSPSCAINAWLRRPKAAALHATEFRDV
jgi:cupin-like protein